MVKSPVLRERPRKIQTHYAETQLSPVKRLQTSAEVPHKKGILRFKHSQSTLKALPKHSRRTPNALPVHSQRTLKSLPKHSQSTAKALPKHSKQILIGKVEALYKLFCVPYFSSLKFKKDQLNFSRFSPHTFHLEEKTEVVSAEGSRK